MKAIRVLTGAWLLCLLILSGLSVAQTKNAATDKQRQENLEKIQKKNARQKAAYNNMSEEQKAVARKKALERKTGKSSGNEPVVKTGSSQEKLNAENKKGSINAKPVKIPKGPKPTPVFTTSKAGTKTSEPAKPAIKTSEDKKPIPSQKPGVVKPVVRLKSPAPVLKKTNNTKDKK